MTVDRNQSSPTDGGDKPAAEQVERVARAIETHTRQRKTADAQRAEHDGKVHWWSRVSAVAVIAYTLITVCVLVASIRSIQETRRATHYASKAANAATNQAIIAADTEQRQLRAYVYLVPSITNFLPGETPSYTISARNEGETPAYNISQIFSIAYKPQTNPPVAVEGPPDEKFKVDLRLSGQGWAYKQKTYDIVMSHPPVVTQEIYDSVVVNKTAIIVLWGRVAYADVFKSTHRVDFCFYWPGVAEVKNGANCIRGNESD